jgi:hypothetical protein
MPDLIGELVSGTGRLERKSLTVRADSARQSNAAGNNAQPPIAACSAAEPGNVCFGIAIECRSSRSGARVSVGVFEAGSYRGLRRSVGADSRAGR